MTERITRKVAGTLGTAILLMAAVGCGSNDEPEETPGTMNQAQAKTSTRSMASAVLRATREHDGPNALALLVSGAIQAQTMVRPQAKSAPSESPQGGGIKILGTCSCVGTTCTYDACTPAGTQGVVVNGTFTFADGHLVCSSLEYKATASGADVTVTLDCDVTAKDGAMAGFIRSTGSVDVSRLVTSENVTLEPVTWSSNTTLTNIVYDDTGPKTGSARVTATYSTGERTYSGAAQVTIE